jgi:Pyruvate/2-oxoacid:ferredoxin oxidoreductase gamma subunit
VLRNSVLWDEEMGRTDVEVVDVPDADLAVDAGNIMVASMVMLGVLSTVTAIVGLDSLRTGVRACVPSYRSQHLDPNDRALQAGAVAAAPRPACLAWPVVSASGGRQQ